MDLFNPVTGKVEILQRGVRTEQQGKKLFSKEAYRIMREKGTEKAFTGDFLKNKEKGYYLCKACGNYLFDLKDKYESKTGWPSFYDVVDPRNVLREKDNIFFMKRTEFLWMLL